MYKYLNHQDIISISVSCDPSQVMHQYRPAFREVVEMHVVETDGQTGEISSGKAHFCKFEGENSSQLSPLMP